ncbi:efflux RND transporter periplasmic adaptor subunit [Paraprevotella clara]|uniref:efflux RND transporter periplasmic adaptor subunit n=1 Tax=Paraprevotella clara TaxID=454154 RepID=UPI00307AA113
MKKFNVIIGGFILFLFTACSHTRQESSRLQTVKTDTVISAAEQSILQYPGKVKAAEDASLSFRVSGTIRRIYVKDGARVRKGQLLADLDPTDYQIQLDATEAEYLQVKSEAERVMALYKDGGTTPAANDKAEYGLKQITAKYNHHKDLLSYTRLCAPFDGYIDKHLFEPYETVGAGMPVITMIGDGRTEVEINLPAAEYIRRGQFKQYYCTFDIYPDKHYSLQPLYIIPKANANQLYTMRLRQEDTDQPQPSPGMNTMVTILCDTAENAPMSIPGSAILYEDGKTNVFLYDAAQKKVYKRNVTLIGLQTDGRATIISAQIKPGDLIVSSGIHHIQDGESVMPLPAVSKTNIGGLL